MRAIVSSQELHRGTGKLRVAIESVPCRMLYPAITGCCRKEIPTIIFSTQGEERKIIQEYRAG